MDDYSLQAPARSGPRSVWWYGRALRVYFFLSLLVSALWIARVLLGAQGSAPAGLAAPRPQQGRPSGFAGHVYCLNQPGRLGRGGRMTELLDYMHVDAEMFGRGHIDAWRDMLDRGYPHALIVEDDIDFETDALAVVQTSMDALRSAGAGWDMLYFGHCSMEEDSGRAMPGGRLFRSVHPFCMSGYALSRSGAQKLHAHFAAGMRRAYALDVQIVALVKRGLVQSYSVHPPVVYQRRDLYPSDDGLELKVARLQASSAWGEAMASVPRLAGWRDPPDADERDPAFKHIPVWMEDARTVH
ncbi:hypothetical protein H4R18_004857 [Coemansia javaensis]|uniref:Glycosyltransferase n=1 Tax=Coemansia javaensis TaxID=2761396 RepID=A0A9W8H9K4_9FUNG|nr:hypothetical protein H4R18_004857 [Coemansia javaensis]